MTACLLDYGLEAQGIKPEGIYRFWLQPYAAIWGFCWVIFYILVSGLAIFWSFNASDFVAAYINIPLFALLYLGFKIFERSKIVPLQNMDFVTGIPTLSETESQAEDIQSREIVQKIKALLCWWA
jgi:amino acid transporter